ncbi:hypothetical protein [Azotobacter vinelandii]|uniref:hypothetical protein n=1 Tax=Azotobacter vinelandii TaxID=354 RepID=UPI000AB01806|nr:hypothetical protein [Azotobacter vinelandii]
MSNKVCFYSRKNHCTKNITKEHAVSKSVLNVLGLIGDGIVKADIIKKSSVLGCEAIVKDVCSKCNNESLSGYDKSGKELVEFLKVSAQNEPLIIPFGNSAFGWLLKTHLNFFRIVKDRLTGKAYKVSQKLKNALIDGRSFDNTLCFFLARQNHNSKAFWGDEPGRKMPSLHYNSKRIFFGDLIYSRLQILQLDTVLFFPVDSNYKNFARRFEEFIERWESDPVLQSQIDIEGYELIDIELLVKRNYFPLTQVMSPESLDRRLRPAFSSEDRVRLAGLMESKKRR